MLIIKLWIRIPPKEVSDDKDASIQHPTIRDPTIRDPTIRDPTIREPTIREPTIRILPKGGIRWYCTIKNRGFKMIYNI
jgi:hypothetical protein